MEQLKPHISSYHKNTQTKQDSNKIHYLNEKRMMRPYLLLFKMPYKHNVALKTQVDHIQMKKTNVFGTIW